MIRHLPYKNYRAAATSVIQELQLQGLRQLRREMKRTGKT